ncbi:class II aaRS and biotin synthetase [Pseudovirgaria hyperparasitica]|uniref:threonine--tRNA ligase n=1 Tax=Pseudovirgaria hyperparasitica TaxID=470096 RepID=A0A6A6W9E6_9PEZI|nr:class II aaRS and biotin synthetase [Pseudovirgaria hyperparasitica]KAF2758644.1 class II aaRS and biotin synthetase [Pseudovirgaria hyperparasitica]
MADPWTSGSPLFNADGAYVFNRLVEFLRAQHAEQGYSEVVTPTIYKKSLWERSGHWENYAQDMFSVVGRGATGTTKDGEVGEDEEFGLKPMNCPGHCVLFSNRTWSHRELPVRYADFSPLHRNENSGSLRGLTRVRRFHQDDGHIFCTPEQIKDEILKELSFVRMVYQTFDLPPFNLVLSTKPTDGSAIGEDSQWSTAESHLKQALEDSGLPWKLNPGDGAFYGPKIDIQIPDNTRYGEPLQAATIQLDFQLPQRFELSYKDADQKSHRPVMIHRAAFGSIERFMHILMTRTHGAPDYKTKPLPFWLTPRPIIIFTLNDKPEIVNYAFKVHDILHGRTPGPSTSPQPLNTLRLPITLDTRGISLSAKIGEARLKGFHFGAVVGHNELDEGTVALKVWHRTEKVSYNEKGAPGASLKVDQARRMFEALCENWM